MYCSFYGLRERPFENNPDPRFLYLGEAHREALAQLLYGVQQRKGFIVLTGEVGTGKTTLLRALLERLDPGVRTALVFNPLLSREEFFRLIWDEFELSGSFEDKAEFLVRLNAFLLELHRRGESALLIVDEAQGLSAELLEEVRLLLNLETSGGKLLQIVLAGQPELRHKLDLPQLRQLRQRVSLNYHLRPLGRRDTEAYVRRRLRVAGCAGEGPFEARALREVHRLSGGIPRLINLLCDHALLLGYALGRRRITASMVRECAQDLGLVGPRWHRRLLPLAAAALLAAALAAWLRAGPSSSPSWTRPRPQRPAAPSRGALGGALPRPSLPPDTPPAFAYTVHLASFRRLADARRLSRKLGARYRGVRILRVRLPRRGVWYRVTLGWLPDRDSAGLLARLLRAQGFGYAEPLRVSAAQAEQVKGEP